VISDVKEMILMNKHTILLVVFLVSFTLSAEAQIVVIANKSVSEKELSQEEILDIYTLNRSRWDSGQRIRVFDFKSPRKLRKSFYKYLDLSKDELQIIWLRKQFTGKGMPPEVLGSEQDIVAKIARTPGAIGYVSRNLVRKTGDVRILASVR